jgi:hypothetical protein
MSFRVYGLRKLMETGLGSAGTAEPRAAGAQEHMLKALASGETNAETLAALADQRLRATQEQSCAHSAKYVLALCNPSHRFHVQRLQCKQSRHHGTGYR